MLADIPGNDAAFKLLQSIDDAELSFVVLPLDLSDGPIAGPDLVAARAALRSRTPRSPCWPSSRCAPWPRGWTSPSISARRCWSTPRRRLGYQHVLANDAYSLRHPLPRADAAHAG